MIEVRARVGCAELLQCLLDAGDRDGFRVRMETSGRLTVQRVGLVDGLVAGPSMYPPPAFAGRIVESDPAGAVVVGDVAWPPGWRLALSPRIPAMIAVVGGILGVALGRGEIVIAFLIATALVFLYQRFKAWWMEDRRTREEAQIREFLARAAPGRRTTHTGRLLP